MAYPGVYRAKAVQINGGVITAYVPQVFGTTPIQITEVIGARPTTATVGWVQFESGLPEFPIWSSGVGVAGNGAGGGTDEVWIAPEEPFQPSTIELWYDTDATQPVLPDYLTQAQADLLYENINHGADVVVPPSDVWTPTIGVSLPGVVGSYVSTPYITALDITDDLDVRVYDVTLPSWTPTSSVALVSMGYEVNTGWELALLSDGRIQFAVRCTGGGANGVGNIPATGFAPGSTHSIAATRTRSSGLHQLFTSDNSGQTWTQLGTNYTGRAGEAAILGTTGMYIGQRSTPALPLGGSIGRVVVSKGYGGTVVANPDFHQAQDTSTFTDAAGRVWTLNGQATIAGYVTTIPGYIDPHPEYSRDLDNIDGGRPDEHYDMLLHLDGGAP